MHYNLISIQTLNLSPGSFDEGISLSGSPSSAVSAPIFASEFHFAASSKSTKFRQNSVLNQNGLHFQNCTTFQIAYVLPILWFFSAIKLLLGILLFTVLNPKCPDGCSCGSYTGLYYYPSVVVLISAYWAAIGYKYHTLQQQQDQSDGSNNSMKSPGVEIA